jgi:hypothetical protein
MVRTATSMAVNSQLNFFVRTIFEHLLGILVVEVHGFQSEIPV